ncbi:MAG: SWIB/MDM2 domain-containing protein [Sphingomonadaceae bacterium]|uniref:SWIB/MDM2 domain-containing protein n=1 Tax=Thermaurantiacus sp. TaxID=2820283 RepID=UPI00298F00FB|nr:SWIB/MDM2 domain-containing protein [Thermaurantiacus sp.]MCS6986577.1 SWIB/MDM2 domain-containing protein [Sphingomonadaceae bacterium]MDW8414162.1 SWIB/MDM2 domain-containing protein [Thermaurantiacus sp.]
MASKKPNALQSPMIPSSELAAIVGSGTIPRGEAVKRVWDYIKAHNLQDPGDRRRILADAKLKKVFGQDSCTMFEMNRHLARHLRPA